jgi:hypothetical protein
MAASDRLMQDPLRKHFWKTVLDLVLLAVAGHSIAVGISLLFAPLWALHLVRWEYAGQVFWPSQAGLFMLILGAAYAWAIRLRPLVWLVIGSKASACMFLLASAVWLEAPRVVLLLACGDGLMGIAVALVFWRLRWAAAR